MGIEKFKNTLDFIKLTSKEIEESISTQKLIFVNKHDYVVEWKMKVPYFIPAFYRIVKKENRIPSQDEFWKFYVATNSKWFDDNIGEDKKLFDALRARAYRTYPSLVRDVHFGIKLKESKLYSTVLHNDLLDIWYGIDLIVGKDGKAFGLNLFTQTKRAFAARIQKKYRHINLDNILKLEFPINMNKSFKCGEFFLYSNIDIERLNVEIAKYFSYRKYIKSKNR